MGGGWDMKWCILLLVGILAGCSANHRLVPASGDRLPVVTVSAFTKAGCLENLRTEALARKWEIREIESSVDAGGLVAEILFFPLVKGMSCSAYVVKGELPDEF
jgi:hypothetical protein